MKVAIAFILVFSTTLTAAEISAPAQARREFGGKTVTQTFEVSDAEGAELVWQAQILRGIVGRGSVRAESPETSVEISLPKVRARVEMRIEVELRRGEQSLAKTTAVMDLFPDDILSSFGREIADHPPIGVYDPDGTLLPALRAAGLPVEELKTNVQVGLLKGGLVLVGRTAPDDMAEPMPGIRAFMAEGGTALFVEQTAAHQLQAGREGSPEFVAGVFDQAIPLVGSRDVLLTDIKQGDFSGWGQAEGIAISAVAWPKQAVLRALLVAPAADATPLPLLAEWRVGRGRAILCQIRIAELLNREPVAQMLLRNLIWYGRAPYVQEPAAQRWAVTSQALERGKLVVSRLIPSPDEKQIEKSAALLLLPNVSSEVCPDLAEHLRNGGTVMICASTWNDGLVAAVNNLVRDVWGNDRRDPPPVFKAGEEFPAPPIVNYEKPLASGLLPEYFGICSLDRAEGRSLSVERDAAGLSVPVEPGILIEFARDKARLVLVTADYKAEDTTRRELLLRTILANLSCQGQEEEK